MSQSHAVNLPPGAAVPAPDTHKSTGLWGRLSACPQSGLRSRQSLNCAAEGWGAEPK